METNEPLPSTESKNILIFSGNVLVKAIDAKIEELFKIGKLLKLTNHKIYEDIHAYREKILAPEVMELVYLLSKQVLDLDKDKRLRFLKIKYYPIINYIYGTNIIPEIRKAIFIDNFKFFRQKSKEWWNFYKIEYRLPSQRTLAGTDMIGIVKTYGLNLFKMLNSGDKKQETRQHGQVMSNAVGH